MGKRGNFKVGGVRFEDSPELAVAEGHAVCVGRDLGNAFVASEFPVSHIGTAGSADRYVEARHDPY